MSKLYRGELQDNLGNTIYPHTEAGLVFCADGETVQQKIAGTAETLDGITGVSDSTELDDSTKLATSKAVNSLRKSVNNRLVDNATSESFNYGVKNGVRGFYTDPSRADDSFVPFKGMPKVIGYLSMAINVEKSFTADNDYDYMVIITAATPSKTTVKINNNVIDATKVPLTNESPTKGYIIIDQKISKGDKVSLTSTNGTSNNMYWFIV